MQISVWPHGNRPQHEQYCFRPIPYIRMQAALGSWVLHACVWPGVLLPAGVGLSLVVFPRLSEGSRRYGASHDAAYPCLGGLGHTYLALMHYSCYQLQGYLLGYEAMLSGSTRSVLACDAGRCRPHRRSFFSQGSLVFLVFYMVFYGVPKFELCF